MTNPCRTSWRFMLCLSMHRGGKELPHYNAASRPGASGLWRLLYTQVFPLKSVSALVRHVEVFTRLQAIGGPVSVVVCCTYYYALSHTAKMSVFPLHRTLPCTPPSTLGGVFSPAYCCGTSRGGPRPVYVTGCSVACAWLHPLPCFLGI